MRVTVKTDYALQAMVELAAASGDRFIRADEIAQAQDIPLKFLLAILNELRRARLVRSQRGSEGGYMLARPATEISLADVIRAIDGPLANVHDASLSNLSYPGAAACLTDVWMAVRGSLRSVLDQTTLADMAAGRLPRKVQALADKYQSEVTRR
jgi:Rrf2 family protein